MSAIEVRDLTIRYGSVLAVDTITFDVQPGEVVGLLGGNGAGKSSTLRAIAGVNPPTSGILRVAGWDLGCAREVERARAAVGYCPDVGGLLRQATVREHIALVLAMRGATHLWPQAMEMVERFGLGDLFDRVTAGFSHGQCRRLSVLLATLTATDVLVLDEPFDGVDPLGVAPTLAAAAFAAERGVGVLVSTHLLDLLAAAAQRVVVMVGGHVARIDDVAALRGAAGVARYEALLRGESSAQPDEQPSGQASGQARGQVSGQR